MAGPSSLEQRDFLEAIRMQLREAGAGEVSPDSLLDISLGPDAATLYDLSTACHMTDAELAVARDATFAHMLARQDTIPSRAGPSTTKCSICLEQTATADRFLSSTCGHTFCTPCMRQHLSIIATETRQYPFLCPQCRASSTAAPAELDPQQCLAVLSGVGEAHSALERLVLENKHFARMRYCANAKCNTPFDWVDDPALKGLQNEFCVTCPNCRKDTCVQCKVLWHEGRTCVQYGSEREGTDAFVQLAKKKMWMECPKCKAMIDRRKEDCYFVRCRCGCGFCHKCGKEYLSLRVGTGSNAHGRPNCRCGLFGR